MFPVRPGKCIVGHAVWQLCAGIRLGIRASGIERSDDCRQADLAGRTRHNVSSVSGLCAPVLVRELTSPSQLSKIVPFS